MRDFFKLIAAHLSNKLNSIGNLKGQIYLFYVALAGSFGAVYLNAYISKSAYFKILQAGSTSTTETDATVMTFAIAILGFISAGFLASVILDWSQGLDRKRGYVETTAAILFALAIIGVDIWANLQGSTFRAFEHSEVQRVEVDQTADKISSSREKVIDKYAQRRSSVENQIAALELNPCRRNCTHIVPGGAAHWDRAVTQFGKKEIRRLKGKLEGFDDQEEKELKGVDEIYGSSLSSASDIYTTTLSTQKGFWKFSAVGAYIIALIASLYASGFSRRALDLVRKLDGKEDIPYYNYDPTNIHYRDFSIEGGKDNTNRPNGNRTNGGYEIECKNCGKQTVKKSPRAKYCSDICRIQYHEREKGYSVANIKRKYNGVKV